MIEIKKYTSVKTLFDFSAGRNYCRLVKDQANKTLTIQVRHITKASTLRSTETFNDTQRGRVKCLKSYLDTLRYSFKSANDVSKEHLDSFIKTVNNEGYPDD